MRNLGWVFVLVVGVAVYLGWRSRQHRPPSGMTAVTVALDKGLWEAGVQIRYRVGLDFVPLAEGTQELETKAGDNELVFVCPRSLVEAPLYREQVPDRHETLGIGLECHGEVTAVLCKVTTRLKTFEPGMVVCRK
jgi:hypothetical protein